MTLSSRERVRLALEHRTTDRIPIAIVCSGMMDTKIGSIMATRNLKTEQMRRELENLRLRVAELESEARQHRQFDERRDAVLRLRDEVLRMQRAEDIQQVAVRLRETLSELEIPFRAFGINVAEQTPEGLIFYTYTWKQEDIRKALPANQIAILENFWRGGKPVYRPDLEAEDPYDEYEHMSYWEMRSVLDVPFSHGTIAFSSPRPDPFSQGHIDTLQELARVLSEGFQRMEDFRVLTLSGKRYRTLVETPPDLVVMYLDTEGNYLYISPQIERSTGLSPETFYADRKAASQIVHPDDFEAGQDAFIRTVQGEILPPRELRWRHRSGDYRWAVEHYIPIFDEDGDVENVQIILRDITGQKQAEEARREIERLRVLNEAAGGAAHEINQPLQGIVGLAEILLMESDISPQCREKLQKIIAQGSRIGDILAGMRNIHRYSTAPYPGGSSIVDFDAASEDDSDAQS